MTTTWVEAATTRARERLPGLQRELEAARANLGELRERLAAVERAAATTDPDADPDVTVAISLASQLLPALVTEAETAVAEATTARRAVRADLLPMEEPPWSKISAARQADARAQGKLDAARLHLGQLQRSRAMALGTVREAGPGSDMGAVAEAEAALRLGERLLPAAQSAVAAAEEAAGQARAAVESQQARAHTLRLDVLSAEPQQAEAALVELLGLVGEERAWRAPR